MWQAAGARVLAAAATTTPAAPVSGVPAGPSSPPAGAGPEWGSAGPIALLILVLIGIAVYFLAKSMNRNLKRVPASFDQPDPGRTGQGQRPGAAPEGEPDPLDFGPATVHAGAGPGGDDDTEIDTDDGPGDGSDDGTDLGVGGDTRDRTDLAGSDRNAGSPDLGHDRAQEPRHIDG